MTGSARSVPGFDLYQAVESCADLLENFGGHMYAAGMTMKPENVEMFTKRFNDYVEEHIDPEMLIPQVDIDSELLFSDITPHFRATLARFQPFGPGNTAPVFVTRNVSNRAMRGWSVPNGTPQDGSDSGTKAQYGDPGHCVPAAETLDMSGQAEYRRLLFGGRESLPRRRFRPTPDQRHQKE